MEPTDEKMTRGIQVNERERETHKYKCERGEGNQVNKRERERESHTDK